MNHKLNNLLYRLSIRFPSLKHELNQLYDTIETLSFWLNYKQRRRLLKSLTSCSSLEGYFEFASNVLPSHQLENEILPFLEYVKSRKPKVVCEIGTAEGGTNFLLSHAVSSVCQIIGVDLYVHNKAKLKYFSRSGLHQTYFQGSSYSPEMCAKVEQFLDGEKIDLLFIDGDHSYEGVKRDFELYSPFVNENGLIIFHDIIPDYKTKLNQDTGRYAGDVPVLWNKVKKNYKHHEFVENKDQDGLGIGLIHWKKDNH